MHTIPISVITITYNAAEVLQPTLDSVAGQSFSDIEHLIIDGASADATLRMVEDYARKAPYDVVVQSEPDHGIYDAMNKGLRRASGRYLVFLNAGDVLHDGDTLQRVADAAEQCRRSQGGDKWPAVVYGDTAIVDEHGIYVRQRRLRPPLHLSWRSFRWGMLVCHQSFYVLTEVARTMPYDLRYRHSADVDWCIRVMKEAERRGLPLCNSGATLSDFMQGGNTTQHHRASLRERFRVMRSHYGLVQTLLLHAWFVVRMVIKK